MKRKITALGLAAAMAVSLAACGSSGSTASESASSSAASTSSVEEAGSTSETSASSKAASSNSASSDDWVINVDDMMAGTQYEGLTADDAYSFQIIVKASTSTYWQAVVKGAEAAAADLGVTVDTQGPNSESDIADQVNMLNNAINNIPDGIGLAASDASAVTDSLQSAMSKGIPVVAFDTPIGTAPEGSIAATIATDSVTAGGVAAEEAWNALEGRVENLVSEGSTARFGVVAQDTTSTNNQQRGLGFIDKLVELVKAAGYSVAVTGNDYYVGNCADKGDASSAQVIIECAVPTLVQIDTCAAEASAIMNETDTICIYGTGGVASEGIIQANDNLGMLGTDPETDIIGIGFDSGSIVMGKINDGTLYGAITQMPYAMGYYTVCALVKLANGDTVDDLNITGYFYNTENMEDELIAPNLYE